MTYRIHPISGVIHITTNDHIPPIKSDPRWIAYQQWVKAGNVPEPAPIPPPEPEPEPVVPRQVTMRQARLALLAAGKLAGVDAAINALPEPERTQAKIEWEYSQEVERWNPLIAMIAPSLGLDDEDLDVLFVQAAML